MKEAYAEGMQPSMSWSWLLLECSYPFGREFEHIGVGEPARYGSAFHGLIADRITTGKRPVRAHLEAAAKQWAVPGAVDELHEHVGAAFDILRTWLGKNEFRLDYSPFFEKRDACHLFVEEAVALKPLESGRYVQPHDEDHRYHGLDEGEQPGTLDLAIKVSKKQRRKLPLVVLDHKTGEEDFSRPLDKPQLLSLAAATMRAEGEEEAIVGVLHARRRGLPKVYAEKVTLAELRPYERRLKDGLERIGSGWMRPGPQCHRCPARDACPGRDGEILSRAGEVLTGLTAAGGALSAKGLVVGDLATKALKAPAVMTVERKLGLLYDVVKKAEALAGRAREEIRKAIIASGGSLLPETPSGEYLVVREFEKESLSKRGIIEAYGSRKGEEMIARLRADGAIKKTTVKQLWPEKERGRGG